MRILLSSLSLLFAAGAAAEAPGVRNAHAMAYDERAQAVAVFGGADERQVLGDLWSLTGDKWTRLAESGPGPRTFANLVYDASRQRLLLFGGNKVLFGAGEENTFLNDLWSWEERGWTRIDAAGAPPPRAEAAAAFDTGRGVLVVFGGHATENGERVIHGDTWEWDGEGWRQISAPGPTPRNGAAMAYDAARGAVVLFGGRGASGETWAWDGRRWTLLATAEPGRFNPAMTYDGARKEIIRFGGWKQPARSGDTWVLKGDAWAERAVAGPAPRNHSALAFDAGRGVAVLYGGHDGERVFGDVWAWNGAAWTLLREAAALERLDNEH